ncbi:hypothetical protein A4D02_08850 [Niastella koreensis]|uniref:Photosynthesis system II assembly factor Ycf48/Hcf136-like domain-containing protein n=2 Tax=Niastella koreensis TaxID=354356 RepID=G8TQ99_NIAKG|nr:YCF48-related protein [Niastella koreensis]AEW02113.1 hypothetical protein Niako_5883 [Niastella koreensis GR20-10]OQP48800.1 hypothetical protein A4D02_08850 [Niastella koreensis]
MRVPVFLLLFAFSFHFHLSFAQPAGKALINFSGYGYNLVVNKNNQLVLTTPDGEIAFADSVNGIWRKTHISALPDGAPNSKIRIYHTCYFNADTAFVSGRISGDDDRLDLIYRTTDGGKSWAPIKFGLNGWVYDATFLDNGEAWLSVDEKGIAYTRDYGLSWNLLPFPFNGQRFHSIYFNNKREGLVAGGTNGLAYTKDNGKTWISLTTPLNQGKYKKTAFMREPYLDGVAIFRDYLLVCQEYMVFYSRKDKINWVYMPGYSDFYTDPYNRALFFETRRGKFIKCDSKLKPVATFDGAFNKKFCRNGKLFSFHINELTQITAGNQLMTFPAYTNDTTGIVAHNFGHTGHGSIGAAGNKIYLQESRNGKWRYAFTLPFATDSGYLQMKGYDTILFVNRSNDSVFYYSIKDGQVEKRERKKMIADFSKAGLKKIIFSKGSSGDFYRYWNVIEFESINGKFVRTRLDTAALNGILMPKEIPDTLSYQKVTTFGEQIPELYQKQLSFDELGFTPADYDSCKKHILQFKAMLDSNKSEKELRNCPFSFNINNLDFSKLLSLVDRIGKISPAAMNDFLHRHNYASTDEDYINIELINGEGKALLIHYLYYEGRQPYFFAWWLELNGLHADCAAIEINRFLNDVFPNFLKNNEKVDLLQELVKFVYEDEALDN